MLYTLLAQEHCCDLIHAILDYGCFYVKFLGKLFTYCVLCWIKILK